MTMHDFHSLPDTSEGSPTPHETEKNRACIYEAILWGPRGERPGESWPYRKRSPQSQIQKQLKRLLAKHLLQLHAGRPLLLEGQGPAGLTAQDPGGLESMDGVPVSTIQAKT